MLDSAIAIGSAIMGATTVFVKGVGILALQASQAPYFATYDKISEDTFTLIEDQMYVFEQTVSGDVICSKELPRNIRSEQTYTIEKGASYSITNVTYFGQLSEEHKNGLAEEITIKIGDNEKSVKIKLDSNDFGLSVKDRISLLEQCR